MSYVPVELLQIIYEFADIDTKTRLNKYFGVYFFKNKKIAPRQNHISQLLQVQCNKYNVLNELVSDLTEWKVT